MKSDDNLTSFDFSIMLIYFVIIITVLMIIMVTADILFPCMPPQDMAGGHWGCR